MQHKVPLQHHEEHHQAAQSSIIQQQPAPSVNIQREHHHGGNSGATQSVTAPSAVPQVSITQQQQQHERHHERSVQPAPSIQGNIIQGWTALQGKSGQSITQDNHIRSRSNDALVCFIKASMIKITNVIGSY